MKDAVMVEIDWSVVLVQLVTFLIAVPLVWNSMIKALLRTLKAREEHITGTLDKIEKDKSAIESLKTDYEKKIREMHVQSAAAVNKALADGEKMKNSIVDEARNESRKLIEEAKNEIAIEKTKAIEEVRDAIVDISMLAAEKAIKKKVSRDDQLSIVNDQIKKIGTSFH
jgi:F-type H+-transporting ATPase subunit b